MRLDSSMVVTAEAVARLKCEVFRRANSAWISLAADDDGHARDLLLQKPGAAQQRFARNRLRLTGRCSVDSCEVRG